MTLLLHRKVDGFAYLCIKIERKKTCNYPQCPAEFLIIHDWSGFTLSSFSGNFICMSEVELTIGSLLSDDP